MLSDCLLTTGLAPYVPNTDMPWDAQRARHVFRRLGFGASDQLIQSALTKSPGELVDELLDDALFAEPIPTPVWSQWSASQYNDFQQQAQEQILDFGLAYLNDMLTNPLRAKLTLFWQNHFVTRFEQYACPSWMYQYYQILEQNCFGNFKTFTKEVGVTPAMLVFLNGVQNTRLSPNENYARELFELFTLGRDQGYTEMDITESARALTGWNGFSELCAPIGFTPLLHDPGQKTIFGRIGAWNYDSLHDILFEERAALIARHVCRKLYRHYVSPDVDEEFVSELANILLTANFELEPIYRVLFKSERFFDNGVISTRIKSPLELFIAFVRESEFPMPVEIRTLLLFQAAELGQLVFNPPDVSGWPGDKAWVTSSLLTQRWIALDAFIWQTFINEPHVLTDWIKEVAPSWDQPEVIVKAFVDALLPQPLQREEDYHALVLTFKSEIPENYFEDGSWNLDWVTVPAQTGLLLQQIIRLPEFQIN